ncbi:unnamed protein product [Pleuronectes platessa]|uniref:Uncharacterized protein n=1 Tax=Pleuronectes platessa TaxID=8262 RepID=A0A9N7YV70_PLEPL|nr:unnamed protein product [Pleuronectes platessa]
MQIEALKDGNSSLKEQVEQLRDQLRDKDGLIKNLTKKRHARFTTYMDCLVDLTECQAKCTSPEASLHQEPPQPETSWNREVEVEKEHQALKEQVNLLKVVQRRLVDELVNQNQLIMSVTKKRRTRTNAYIDCLAVLTATEKELKKSLAKTLEVKLQQTRSERQMQKEQVNILKSERAELEALVRDKDELMKTNKRQAPPKSYLAFFEKLSDTENELERDERIWRREEQQQGTWQSKGMGGAVAIVLHSRLGVLRGSHCRCAPDTLQQQECSGFEHNQGRLGPFSMCILAAFTCLLWVLPYPPAVQSCSAPMFSLLAAAGTKMELGGSQTKKGWSFYVPKLFCREKFENIYPRTLEHGFGCLRAREVWALVRERRWTSGGNLDYGQKRSLGRLWFDSTEKQQKDESGLICPKIQEDSPYPV